MNLYQVSVQNDEWCTFVFAETRNKAKAMMVGWFFDEEYTATTQFYAWYVWEKGYIGEPTIRWI